MTCSFNIKSAFSVDITPWLWFSYPDFFYHSLQPCRFCHVLNQFCCVDAVCAARTKHFEHFHIQPLQISQLIKLNIHPIIVNALSNRAKVSLANATVHNLFQHKKLRILAGRPYSYKTLALYRRATRYVAGFPWWNNTCCIW